MKKKPKKKIDYKKLGKITAKRMKARLGDEGYKNYMKELASRPRPRKKFTVTCAQCGASFKSASERTKRCEACNKLHKRTMNNRLFSSK